MSKELRRNVVCFFVFGLQSLIFDEITLVAAEDVLAGSKLATSSIILSIALPLLLIKLTAPWILQRLPRPTRVVLIVVLFVVGMVTVVFSARISGRLAGVSITESAVALSEIAFLSLTAFYQEIALSAFVAGIGTASLLGPLYYTGNDNDDDDVDDDDDDDYDGDDDEDDDDDDDDDDDNDDDNHHHRCRHHLCCHRRHHHHHHNHQQQH